MSYIQAVPLFTKEDDESFAYFRDHKDELDAMTGDDITLAIPETVLSGDAKDIYSAAGSPRYKGLKRGNLPCLWIEDKETSFALTLPTKKEEIVKLLRNIADAAKKSNNVKELRNNIRFQHLPIDERPFYRNTAII